MMWLACKLVLGGAYRVRSQFAFLGKDFAVRGEDLPCATRAISTVASQHLSSPPTFRCAKIYCTMS